jgi:hypothetical protein
MKRVIAILGVVALVATAATAVLVWRLVGTHTEEHPEISAYSHGQLARVGPYRYCDVFDLNNCEVPETTGELTLNPRDAVQLSVPPSISRAPWVLLLAYEDENGPPPQEFRPGSTLAVTIPSVDPRYGKLQGLAVQLPTLVRDEQGNEFPFPHAEWSVRMVWA